MPRKRATKNPAIKCGPVPTLRDWRALPTSALTRAERNMRFVESYLKVPEGALVGQPIKLADFQQAFFYAVYDNKRKTRRAYLSMARKNSKTATIACIVLVHLVGPEAKQNSQIVSGARSREQAAIVHTLAAKMVQMSPELSKIVRVVPSGKRLFGLPMNVEYRALSAEAGTAHGLGPIVAIIDEAGQIRGAKDDFVEAITTSQGAHADPLLIVISTQAPTDGDLLSIWLDDAERSQDPHIVSHVYAASADCEVLDQDEWKAANPALDLFRSRKDLEEQAKQAHRMPSAESGFRNLVLNQRVSADNPFVSKSVWANCAETPAIEEGAPVFLGLDLSSVSDLTALVMISEVDGVWQVVPTFWLPREGLEEKARTDRVPYDLWHKQGFLEAAPGRTIDYAFVAERLREIFTTYDVQAVGFDRWGFEHLKQHLERAGFDWDQMEKFKPHGQGFKDMSPALRELEADLLNQRLAHGGHPVLSMCAANATVQMDPAGNRKLIKQVRHRRIDGMVALAMARGVASAQDYDGLADVAPGAEIAMWV